MAQHDFDITVLVPTYNRLAQLKACLHGIAAQTVDNSRMEILIGVDGPDNGETKIASRLLPNVSHRVLCADHAGPAATRNRLIEAARSPLLLMLNDDVVPAPDLAEHHLLAHAVRTPDEPAIVLGSAPWVVGEPDRLFDRLIRETSMVFFYNTMNDANPDHDWGFRHAWTLNLSVPTACVRAVGGFCTELPGAAYEDIELAYRLVEQHEMPVLFRPRAVVHHDHRYEPGRFLEREQSMGRDAWTLSGASPACARAIFGRDLRGDDEIAYNQAFVEREAPLAARLAESFRSLADLPASAAAHPQLIGLLFEQHLLLKRWYWRKGLLEGAGVFNAVG